MPSPSPPSVTLGNSRPKGRPVAGTIPTQGECPRSLVIQRLSNAVKPPTGVPVGVCDDLGTCASVDNSWTHVWRDYNGNRVPGPPSGYPPDYSVQWTQMK